jgi:hypothetical protein
MTVLCRNAADAAPYRAGSRFELDAIQHRIGLLAVLPSQAPGISLRAAAGDGMRQSISVAVRLMSRAVRVVTLDPDLDPLPVALGEKVAANSPNVLAGPAGRDAVGPGGREDGP